MRDLRRGRKLKRVAKQRRALLRGLATHLILHEKIETTQAKAKELRPFVEQLITCAKQETLHKKRLASRTLSNQAARKLIVDIAPRYKERPGGYTRIIKSRTRKGDAALMAIIKFV